MWETRLKFKHTVNFRERERERLVPMALLMAIAFNLKGVEIFNQKKDWWLKKRNRNLITLCRLSFLLKTFECLLNVFRLIIERNLSLCNFQKKSKRFRMISNEKFRQHGDLKLRSKSALWLKALNLMKVSSWNEPTSWKMQIQAVLIQTVLYSAMILGKNILHKKKENWDHSNRLEVWFWNTSSTSSTEKLKVFALNW